MSTENSEVFTRDTLDLYLKELAKEYKKLGGRNFPIEIILIGGAAIIERYGFREMTTDIDAVMPAVSIMKEAIRHVGDHFGLPNGWLNEDFKMTDSYSTRLSQYSVPYKTFNQVLRVRVVTGEYLIAMKLRAGRKYKNDLSDVVGILSEHEAMGKSIGYDQIDLAVKNLYGSWEGFSDDSVSFIHHVLEEKDYRGMYEQIREGEKKAREILIESQDASSHALREDDIDRILAHQTKQTSKSSVLAQLRQRKKTVT
ncbi:MAG: DUF6036 family nucleotidyltransferase [Lachnospiraceae bacterium]|nr:DUF6036 family nucleotidyltransferase [Lachnospiraceae bacterium]